MQAGLSAQVPDNVRSSDAAPIPLNDAPVRCPGDEDSIADGNESHDETKQADGQLISDIRKFADDAISKLMSLFRNH